MNKYIEYIFVGTEKFLIQKKKKKKREEEIDEIMFRASTISHVTGLEED